MVSTNPLSFLSPQLIKVWVLAPHLHSNDANIKNYRSVIKSIAKEKETENKTPVVFNLCDGDEINGTPGVSVIRFLDEKGLLYTGADDYFYNITTSKIPMKTAFDKAKVPTANWQAISNNDQNLDDLFENLGTPVIVKPSVSGGSMGVGIKNVVYNKAQLKEQVKKMFGGYRGWHLATDGLIAESFITGPEFTVLISGSYNNPKEAKIYTPVERVFHPSLPEEEKFLSFDRLWEIYEEETPMPNNASFYEYATPDVSLIDKIKKISWNAYVATKGCGYTRVDIRMDKETGKLYVLEVNAQCGLSEDEDFTSIGAILRFSENSFTQLVAEIINDAFTRRSAVALKRRIA